MGNYDVLTLGRYGGTSDDKISGGEFGRWIVSKTVTDDIIWMGTRVYWTVGINERYLMRVLVGVIFGWPLRKCVESLLGSILVSGKGYEEVRYLS